MAELLLELLSEEIPARMQDRALADLTSMLEAALDAAGLAHGALRGIVTPRRIALTVADLAIEQQDQAIERRGPRIDAPEKARQGFLSSLGAETYELGEIDDKKGRFLVARFTKKGRPTADILAEALPDILARFPWPKSMRWGEGEARWVRPLQSILCLLDGVVVPFAFAGIASGATTHGHRFTAPEPLDIVGADDYGNRLFAADVVIDSMKRRELIEAGATKLASAQGLRLRADERLLDELKGLVEWPVPLLGRIDASFMELPEEVLVTTMREHQKYLALEDEQGRLAPFFVAVANIAAPDGGEAIRLGNERVLRARLWDARFFWDQDRKIRLEDRLPRLEAMVFHADLGSLRDKVERIETLARWLAPMCKADADEAALAARLAKADLVTGMVGELPELQGVMGGYYARHEGLGDAVADAIAAHYRPQGPGDACPTAPVAVAVALADKLDTLTGFFHAGERPTGSKDPFALRRAALAIIRLILENNLRLDLVAVFQQAFNGFGDRFDVLGAYGINWDIVNFLQDRLAVQQRDAGIRHDVIKAVTAIGDQRDLVDLVARARALQALLGTEDGANLLAAYRRAWNIVRIESEKDGVPDYLENVDQNALVADEERALFAAFIAAREPLKAQLGAERHEQAMSTLAGLRGPIDAFFDKVMVNVDDPALRLNRLRLLSLFESNLNRIANLSLIED